GFLAVRTLPKIKAVSRIGVTPSHKEWSLKDPPQKSAFSFHHTFLEVKHGKTAAKTNLFGAKLLEKSKAGPPTCRDEFDWANRYRLRDWPGKRDNHRGACKRG